MLAKSPSVAVALNTEVMSPTLTKGTVLVGRFGTDCARWDVIGFRHYLSEDDFKLLAEINGVPPEKVPLYQNVKDVIGPPQIHFIGRVVALGGETFELRSGNVYIDGKKTEPPAKLKGLYSAFDNKHFTFGSSAVVVPEGCIFVLKDNPGAIMDSRRFGPIQLGQIMGKMITTTSLSQLSEPVLADIYEHHPTLAN
ncbi:signal peptidase I [Chromobacterium aquaticum]|uniref:Signal peptidase I n=1 Tax=Chromobacterium aquaticum TaxID=467180 RepID=A0ABV8ZMN1_9NEIS|nr:signal peptidase I [Chromobacterium aquaticum]MCD5361242.1 signal peptidase I [Chromobacterium aquaticum]